MDHRSRNHSIKEVTATAPKAASGAPTRRREASTLKGSAWEELREETAESVCGGVGMISPGVYYWAAWRNGMIDALAPIQ